MKNAIEIRNVVKSYQSFKLDDVSLDIPSGIIVGLIGENGAGKTTLIKLILNIINQDSGKIKIYGEDNKSDAVKENIGVVLDGSFFPELLNPSEINSIMKYIYKTWDEKLFFTYLDKFAIDKKQQLKTMSKGTKKKVEIVAALSHHPKLLILDEATSGLDPVVRSEVIDIFMEFIQDEEHTILFSTHITGDLEHIADRIIFIDKGKLLVNSQRDVITDCYGVLKCDEDVFDSLDKDEYIAYRKSRYFYEVLVTDRERCRLSHPDCIIDRLTLDELMVLMIKGGRCDDRND